MILDPESEATPAESARLAAEYRRRSQEALVRARALLGQEKWKSDPGLRVQVEMILAMPPAERVRQLEAEVAFYANVRPAT